MGRCDEVTKTNSSVHHHSTKRFHMMGCLSMKQSKTSSVRLTTDFCTWRVRILILINDKHRKSRWSLNQIMMICDQSSPLAQKSNRPRAIFCHLLLRFIKYYNDRETSFLRTVQIQNIINNKKQLCLHSCWKFMCTEWLVISSFPSCAPCLTIIVLEELSYLF